MCGLTLLLRKNGSFSDDDKSLLARSNEALRHRGPDDEALWTGAMCGLAFRRLSIVDITGGQQPFFSEDKSIVCVCNGEIYNFEALRRSLEEKGHRFVSRSDCEVILHLYEEDPDQFVAQLEGMFAFVIVDTRKRRVLAARDRFGIKPLFMADTADTLALSSEIKGLLAMGCGSRNLDREAIQEGFVFGYIPGARTAVAGVRHLLPGHLLCYDASTRSMELTRYWTPEFAPTVFSDFFGLRGYMRGLREGLSAAVDSHAIGDVPMSSYLSGGIDSTVIAALLERSKKRQGQMVSFSIGFSDKRFDESRVFSESAKALGIESRVFTMTHFSPKNFFDAIVTNESVQFSVLDVPLIELARLVHEHGRKVVLVGEGSDEIFGGYVYFALAQAFNALSLPSTRSLRETFMPKVVEHYFGSSPTARRIAQVYVEEAQAVVDRLGFLPPWYPVWRLAHGQRRGLFLEEPGSIVGPDSFVEQTCREISARYAGLSGFDRSVALELQTRLPNYVLTRGDRNSMSQSVELRLPFLDRAVVDFVTRVPALFKMFGLREKYLLRKAFADIVPRAVVKGRKVGFEAPSASMWQCNDPLLGELLSEEALRETGVFEPQAIAEKLRMIREADLSAPSTELADAMSAMNGVFSTQALYYGLLHT